jgi:hypothetical protein
MSDKTMTDQKQYWLHVDHLNNEDRYAELPPHPLARQVLHVWIIDDKTEETRTWKRKDDRAHPRTIAPPGYGWRLHDDSPKDHSVWRRSR